MRIKQTLLTGCLLGCVAALGAYLLYYSRVESPARKGVLSSGAFGERTTYYLNTERGFGEVRAERFSVPFSLQTVEWRSDDHAALIVLRLTHSAPAQTGAGYCVEIVANDNHTLIWWGYNLRPKIASTMRMDQAAVVDLAQNAVIGYGQVKLHGDTVQITLPEPLRSVEVAYLRYIPSQHAFKQSGGSVEIVSIARSQSAPAWGARVRSLQGGYVWREEAQ